MSKFIVVGILFLVSMIDVQEQPISDVPDVQIFEIECTDGYRRYTAVERFNEEKEKAMCEVVFP